MFARLGSKKTLLMLLALAVWGVFLWRAINVFKPGVYSATFFNSDCAIPVLMSNDSGPITLYNLYYFGIDRIGGWPYLFAQALRRSMGFHWSPQRLSTFQTTWLFIGALVFGALSRRDAAVAVISFLLVLCLHSETRYQIFTLAVNYPWQIPAILFSWYGLRQIIEKTFARELVRWKHVLWLVFTFVFSYFAIWSSIESIPFLLFILCLEVFRQRMKLSYQPPKALMKSFAQGLAPILLASFAERLQKINYYRHSFKEFGVDFKTRFEPDLGNLGPNLKAQVANLTRMEWWPFDVLTTLVILAMICVAIYTLVRKRTDLLLSLKKTIADDTMILIIGAYGIAAINFVLTLLVTHVRLNVYEDRYLIPTTLFGPVSAILILFVMFRSSLQAISVRRIAKPVFLCVSVALLWLIFPSRTYHADYDSFQTTANVLAQQAPRAVLLGDYWGTYVVAAIQPANAITPVPLHEYENRMPWTKDILAKATQVLIEYRRSGLEIDGQPPSRVNAYGNSFRLIQPKVFEHGDFVFGWYAREQ